MKLIAAVVLGCFLAAGNLLYAQDFKIPDKNVSALTKRLFPELGANPGQYYGINGGINVFISSDLYSRVGITKLEYNGYGCFSITLLSDAPLGLTFKFYDRDKKDTSSVPVLVQTEKCTSSKELQRFRLWVRDSFNTVVIK